MKLEVNKIYSGFRLLEEQELKEISSKGYIFEHEKSKARLVKIANDDDNKVFSIGFRTPPEDSTGVPHILEHSVLCGSRKFNTKEPFVELLKGSLNTFLNAMTFPDKTIYPVASKNEKDYFNLMDVYLDAVLYPNIYKYKEIFMQEGWHYELEGLEGDLSYNGVVYNEMKGAYSSPDSMLYRSITKTLFPDNTYRESSGGDPDYIPKLSYEEFINFHKKYYHPSNSYILVYGDGDVEKELSFINDNYLKDFEATKIDSFINIQKSFSEMKEFTYTYGVAEEDGLDDKTSLNLNFVVGEATDGELYLAMEILTHLLLKTPAAPIRKALLDNGIGKAVSGEFNNSMKQPVFSVVAKNANENDKEKFKNVVLETLRKLVDDGISKELIEASLNKVEFELREGDFEGYPKGLIFYLKIMDSWLYDSHPFTHLHYEKWFESIKSALTTDYFEAIIKKYILDNTHSSLIVLKPEKGLNEKKEVGLKEKLELIKKEYSEEELKKIIKESEALRVRQNTPDSDEALSTIPMLSLEDIDRKAEHLPLEVKVEEGMKTLFHKLATNKIVYGNLYFNTSKVPQNEIQYIRLLSDILGKIDTENYSYGSLSNEINIHTGGIQYNPISLSQNNSDEFIPYLSVGIKVLFDKLPKGVSLVKEILKRSKLDDSNRLFQLIKETKSRIEGRLIDNGHRIALRKILAYSFPKGAYDEELLGYNYYKFLEGLEKNFESNKNAIVKSLQNTASKIFTEDNITISFGCDSDEETNVRGIFLDFAKSLGCSNSSVINYSFDLGLKNEGFLTQGNVQFVAKGGNYKKDGFKYSGALNVLESILGFDYLWNSVRVKGGAYGVFANFRRDGGAYIVSYRDPNVKETIKVYDETCDYLEGFTAGKREMDKYIIGTVRKLDHPLTNSMKCEVADINYLSGINYEDLQKERDEVINTSEETIKAFAPMTKALMNQGYVCALGNEKKLRDNSDVFKTLIKTVE